MLVAKLCIVLLLVAVVHSALLWVLLLLVVVRVLVTWRCVIVAHAVGVHARRRIADPN